MLQPLRERYRGVVALLPGGVFKNAQVFDLQREIRRPFTWTALLTVAGFPYHEKVIAEHDAAWAEGVEVWPQVSCRPLTFQMNLLEPFTFNTRPAFQDLMGKTTPERIAAYRDPQWRAKAWSELSPGAAVRGLPPTNWKAIYVAEAPSQTSLVGRRVVELADERGVTPLDVMLDVALSDDLETRFSVILANDDEDGIAWLLPRDHVLLGLADSGAHVSQLCDACFATDLLGNWVRERGVMPLERAVHKLTGEPATVFGLADRGTLEVGKAADITVFDPEAVAPGPLRRVRDLPAGGERLTADSPTGIAHVLVNGMPIRVDGKQQPVDGSRPGVVLR